MPGPGAGYRTGDAQWNGKMPIAISSPLMSLDTAETEQGAFIAPCDLEIVQITINVVVTPGTAAGSWNFGTRADVGAFVLANDVALGVATGPYDLPLDHADVVTLNVNKGDILEFDTGGEATTTGDAVFGIVMMPRGPA